ncbi:unnamed protein product [Closterium sp. Naga37s-1]|nr:unnamed protein product [Closterium sp. Naga37s-1]
MLRTNDGKKDAKTTKTKEKTTKKAGTSSSSIISGGGNITASGGYGVGPLTKEGQLHRDVVMSAVIESSALQVSFDSFPYYLSDATRNALVDACFIRLRRPEFLRFTADLPSLSTRILLSGPPGSERYQEQLVRALARHLDAKLLIFDLPNMLLQVWLVQVRDGEEEVEEEEEGEEGRQGDGGAVSGEGAGETGAPGEAQGAGLTSVAAGGEQVSAERGGADGGGGDSAVAADVESDGAADVASGELELVDAMDEGQGGDRAEAQGEGERAEMEGDGVEREGEGAEREEAEREEAEREGGGAGGEAGGLQSVPCVHGAGGVCTALPDYGSNSCSAACAISAGNTACSTVSHPPNLAAPIVTATAASSPAGAALSASTCEEAEQSGAAAGNPSASTQPDSIPPPSTAHTGSTHTSTAAADDGKPNRPEEEEEQEGQQGSSTSSKRSSGGAGGGKGGVDLRAVKLKELSSSLIPRSHSHHSKSSSSSSLSSSHHKKKGSSKGSKSAAKEGAGEGDGAGKGGSRDEAGSGAAVAGTGHKVKSKGEKEKEGAGSDGKKSSESVEGSKKGFKKGDRVRYMGPPSLSSAAPPPPSASLLPPSMRGPPVGLKGRVVVVLEENPHRVGVRFDKPIPGGSSLVDVCDDGHGAWCHVSELRLEGAAADDVEKQLVDHCMAVAATVAATTPLIVFIPGADRIAAAHYERLVRLERMERLGVVGERGAEKGEKGEKGDKGKEGKDGKDGKEKSEPLRLVVIGSHTVPPKKDKAPAAAAAPKATDKLSALLDLSFLDQLSSRPEDGRGEGGGGKGGGRAVSRLFPTSIPVLPPAQDDDVAQRDWARQLEGDVELMRAESNRRLLRSVMCTAGVECADIDRLSIASHSLPQEGAERMVGWAISHQLQHSQQADTPPARLPLSLSSIQHGVEVVEGASQQQPATQRKALKDVTCDNDFERLLLGEVIPAEELGVRFEHIGALEGVKEALREVVMLPLQRPELFQTGQLTKPVRGLLLFGPPGTGKTMLGKAVATESGANFISLSMASVASKWFGEAEKYVKAVFTLASKIAPCVIFVDEVDSMLGRRGGDSEHSAMRKLKNEFMAAWDGLRSKQAERILVLGATNRPHDLDDAVIRRFPRRLFIDLPDCANRAKILAVILKDEELERGFSTDELAAATDGYSGSDLKNLCVTAAFLRIKEFLDKEKKEKEEVERKEGGAEGSSGSSGLAASGSRESEAGAADDGSDSHEFPGSLAASPVAAPCLRPISMEDMRKAMEKVRASVSSDAAAMMELMQWNEQFGEGASRKITPLSYFM